jgi:hypothetical protein
LEVANVSLTDTSKYPLEVFFELLLSLMKAPKGRIAGNVPKYTVLYIVLNCLELLLFLKYQKSSCFEFMFNLFSSELEFALK